MSKAKKLGIIAAPGWFDPTQGEFEKRHSKEDLAITQTIMPPVGFGWSFEEIAGSEEHIETAASILVEAGSQLVVEVGPAFAYLIGGDPAGARSLQERLSRTCGAPVILNGVAVLDALERLGARRVAVVCPYYSPEWKMKLTEFLNRTDYTVSTFGTFVENKIFAHQAEVDARHYRFTSSEVQACIRRTVEKVENVDAVLIGGSGVRTLDWIETLQADLGLPLVSADQTLYCAAVKELGLRAV